jgi:flagellar motor switch protein FliG
MENEQVLTSHASLLNENDRTVAFVIAYTPLHNGAEILTRLTPERQSEVVRQLAEFQLDDSISGTDIVGIVATSQWAVALKGSSEELNERIYKNMSKRAAKILQEDIKYLGPQRVSDVEAVQREIVYIMRCLDDADEITLPR